MLDFRILFMWASEQCRKTLAIIKIGKMEISLKWMF